ncbi:rfaE bifunctional protein kinase chain/domain [Breznakibacter xylanolyticus]|uniref:RfaE bifunctional protein kinase chain/domain n=1 Tax=Breznakibacter xylanolyticus TaxID=990 RepID=A0A2W7NHA3_9BACT|nr:bifunctional ADP-heptose synthase [Breznakibacter xylanolyticus]PZX19220.1 rfaE bifunctional protein kinase chain/domain [Breznakibacter xylanolyticus]
MSFNLARVFEGFSNLNVLVIGDVMIDAYLWGEVSRISPEAPVPILSKTTHENRLGGAGNVALNLQSLGANPILCAVIGNDAKAATFMGLLNDNRLDSDGIILAPERITTVKTRIISQNQHMLRVDEEDSTPISCELTVQLQMLIGKLIDTNNIHAIIFEDYDKGVITPELISFVVDLARKHNIPTLVDPKKRNYDYYRGLTFFKPNFKEFKEGQNVDLSKNDQLSILEEARKFLTATGNEYLMVTMAEKGVFICGQHEHAFFPAQIRNIADVSGAGDTVISVCALCLASGLTPQLVAQIANMSGGLVCEKPGVVPVDKSLLLEECLLKIPDLKNH